MEHVEQVEQVEQGGGNTSNPSLKSRKYCFTLNNYTLNEVEQIIRDFGSDKYVIGCEIAPETSTPHLQGYLEFKNPRSFKSVKKLLPRAHIEKARGSTKQNYEYCTKDGEFKTNIDMRTPQDKLKEACMREYENVSWHSWQKQILDILDAPPDPRKINWFWEESGNVGKSYLCKYLALTRDVIICEGKKADIFNQVKAVIDEGKIPKVVLMDIPRSAAGYVSYGALEALKNGLMYSGKYEGGQCVFPHPHVICFANTIPDIGAMSNDRWVINEITPPAHAPVDAPASLG